MSKRIEVDYRIYMCLWVIVGLDVLGDILRLIVWLTVSKGE